MIVVKGRLQIRSWTDKDGNKRRSAEVVADNCYFGSTKNDSSGSNNNSGYSNSGNGYGDNGMDYGGYAGGSYTPPQYGGDFAVIDDDDAQLPFDM